MPTRCTSIKSLTLSPGQCQQPINISRSLNSPRYSTAVDIITDLMSAFALLLNNSIALTPFSAVMAIPLYLVFRLQMSISQKIGLCGILGLGATIVVFSVIRVTVTNTTGQQAEISWLALWSSVESCVVIIIACLASFKVLFVSRRGTGRYLTPQHVNSNRQGYGNDSAGSRSNDKNISKREKCNSILEQVVANSATFRQRMTTATQQRCRTWGVKNGTITVGTTKDREHFEDDSSSQKHLREDDVRAQTSFTVEHETYCTVGRAK
jgi:hypothetical protein